MKIDALLFLKFRCKTASCVALSQPTVAFDRSGLSVFDPHASLEQQEPWFGVIGSSVDHALATLQTLDANAAAANAFGFVNIGDGGALLIQLVDNPNLIDHTIYLGSIDNYDGELFFDLIEEEVDIGELIDLPYSPGRAPTASISSDKKGSLVNDLINFTAGASSAPNGRIVEYRWDFGDGMSSSGPRQQHRFSSLGTHHVTLEVVDSYGMVGTTSVSIEVVDLTSAAAVRLSGRIGGNPANTAVYRVDLGNSGHASLAAFSIDDLDLGDGSSGGFTGVDIDAIKLSRDRCEDAVCARDAATDVPLRFSRELTLLMAGKRRAPGRQPLFGTLAVGDELDVAVATPNNFDANATASTRAHGFVSLGDGGRLLVNLETQVSTESMYLYVGEVGANESEGLDVRLSSWPIDLPAKSAAKPETMFFSHGFNLMTSGRFSLMVGGDWDSTTIPISILTNSSGDPAKVSMSPSPLNYPSGVGAVLAYESTDIAADEGIIMLRRSDGTLVPIPSDRIPGVAALAVIHHQSIYGFFGDRRPSRDQVKGVNIAIWDVDVAAGCVFYGCDVDQLTNEFSNYLRFDAGYTNAPPTALGVTFASCSYQPEKVTMVRNEEKQVWDFNVEPHAPIILPEIYVPSAESFNALKLCTAREKDRLRASSLDHEAIHAMLDLEWAEGKYGDTTLNGGRISSNLSTTSTPNPAVVEQFKRSAYSKWCRYMYGAARQPLVKRVHSWLGEQISYKGISCLCATGNPASPGDPGNECTPNNLITSGYSCPCNGVVYDTATECTNNCQVSLSCANLGVCKEVINPDIK